jgi:Zn-dependent protease with chaperone function
MKNLLSRTGGKMVVFTGLLDKISSDHVLAFLMGHEFSHAICRCDCALAVTGRLHLAATSQHRIRQQCCFDHAVWADGRHTGEKISMHTTFFSGLALTVTIATVAFLPIDNFMLMIGADKVFQAMLKRVTELPFSRMMETEADHVGLLISSRACFSPEKASVLPVSCSCYPTRLCPRKRQWLTV